MQTVQDILSVIAETHAQMAKADALLKRAALGKPAALAHLVEPTRHLRDRLSEDLHRLEEELNKHGL